MGAAKTLFATDAPPARRSAESHERWRSTGLPAMAPATWWAEPWHCRRQRDINCGHHSASRQQGEASDELKLENPDPGLSLFTRDRGKRTATRSWSRRVCPSPARPPMDPLTLHLACALAAQKFYRSAFRQPIATQNPVQLNDGDHAEVGRVGLSQTLDQRGHRNRLVAGKVADRRGANSEGYLGLSATGGSAVRLSPSF